MGHGRRRSRTPRSGETGDRLGDEVDVVTGERGVPGVGEQEPFAADRVVGADLSRSAARPGPACAGAAARPGAPRPGRAVTRVASPVSTRLKLLRERRCSQRPLLAGTAAAGRVAARCGTRWSGLGIDVRRGALEDGQRADVVDDRRDELDRAGAGADHGHPPAREVDVVAPLRRSGTSGRRRCRRRAGPAPTGAGELARPPTRARPPPTRRPAPGGYCPGGGVFSSKAQETTSWPYSTRSSTPSCAAVRRT